MERRKFVRNVTKAAMAIAFYKCTQPKKDTLFDPDRVNEPNRYQLNFLKSVSKNCHYLCLGDTKHKRSEIHTFAFNGSFLKVLGDTGKKRFFIEFDPKNNKYLVPEISKEEFIEVCPNKFVGNWLYEDGEEELVCSSLYEAINSKTGIEFTAVDQRLSQGFGLSFFDFVKLYPLLFTMSAQNLMHGAVDTDTAAYDLTDLLVSDKTQKKFMSAVVDDTRTAEVINLYNEPSVILFGSGHFDGSAKIYTGKENGMNDLLKKLGKKTFVINIYRDEEDKLESISKKDKDKLQNPDAEMFVVTSKQNPIGINIFNPELQHMYDDILCGIESEENFIKNNRRQFVNKIFPVLS